MRLTAQLTMVCLGFAPAICCAQGVGEPPPAPGPARAQIDPHIIRLDVTVGSDLRFVRLSRSQGLSQQRVTHIVQDDRGFLWFGTQYGLNRYDGYRFRVFKNDPAHSDSLCDVHITALFTDRTGRLWVGCRESVDRYDPLTETFVHYRLERSPNPQSGAAVRHITQDRDGRLWLSTGNGLYSLDPQTRAVQHFAHERSNPFSLSSSEIKFSGEDRSNLFWVATGAGLDQLDRRTGRVTLHVPLHEPGDLKFYEDRSGTFWVLQTSGSGLSILDRRTHRLTRYSFSADSSPGLRWTGVSAMIEDRQGILWAGTLADGILKFDPTRRKFIRYRNDPTNLESPSENRVTTLFEDREGNIWTGFAATEPGFFATRPLPFTRLPFDSRNPHSLGETLVNGIYQDRHGIVWMGTTGALNRYDPRSGQLTHLDIPGNGVASDVISLVEDPSAEAMWIGTDGEGLYRLDTTNDHLLGFRHNDRDPTTLSDDRVIRLFFDSRKQLWIGTIDGLNRLNAATGTFVTYRHGPSGTPHVYRSIVEDTHGILWLDADGNGVQRFDPATGRFTSVRRQASGSPLLYERIQSLYVDHVGVVWAGTSNGLYRYDVETGTTLYYSERNGLPSNTVSCLFEDDYGELWMGTSEGLSRLDRSRKRFKNYSPADGLPGLDFTGWSACFRGPSGQMFFGGFAGAVAFRPEDLRDLDYAPPIAFTGLRVSGVVVEPRANSPLPRAIDYSPRVTLSHRENSFSIEFTALSFRSPATNRYRYRLAGLEDQWQEVGSERRFANYTPLPPGRYRFQIQAATGRGPWGEPGREIAISILPPWWQTGWFRTLVGLIALSAVIGGYKLRMRQIAQQFSIRLDERMNERTRIARELHDSLLQSFQGLIYRLQAVHALLSDRESEAAALLESALDSGDQAIAEGRTALTDLRSNVAAAGDLAESLTSLGKELAADAPPSFSFRVMLEGKERPLAPLVRDDVYRIAREALRNAAQHAKAHHIEAELHYSERAFILRIRDDGIGVDTNVLRDGRRAGHWGMQGMRERAENFGARLDVWSEQDAGTEVELSVPARVAYVHATVHRSWFGNHRSGSRP